MHVHVDQYSSLLRHKSSLTMLWTFSLVNMTSVWCTWHRAHVCIFSFLLPSPPPPPPPPHLLTSPPFPPLPPPLSLSLFSLSSASSSLSPWLFLLSSSYSISSLLLFLLLSYQCQQAVMNTRAFVFSLRARLSPRTDQETPHEVSTLSLPLNRPPWRRKD